MSVRHCVARNCDVKAGQGIPLYSFPLSDRQRRQQWLRIIGLRENDITVRSCICQRHFDPACIMPNGQLFSDALPSVLTRKRKWPGRDTASGEHFPEQVCYFSIFLISCLSVTIIMC